MKPLLKLIMLSKLKKILISETAPDETQNLTSEMQTVEADAKSALPT
jgi:hypothetical protein